MSQGYQASKLTARPRIRDPKTLWLRKCKGMFHIHYTPLLLLYSMSIIFVKPCRFKICLRISFLAFGTRWAKCVIHMFAILSGSRAYLWGYGLHHEYWCMECRMRVCRIDARATYLSWWFRSWPIGWNNQSVRNADTGTNQRDEPQLHRI